MKKVIFTDQLDLSKEIIANLTEEQLQQVEGGVGADGSCTSGDNSCVIIIQTGTSPEVSED
jgi:bacteriocin-like protein